MKNTRLIKALKSFTPGEFRKFLQFVESPFFNQNERLIKLIHHLYKAYPLFSDKKIGNEVLFKLCAGKNQKYDEQKVHDHTSALFKLLEEFWIQQVFKNDAQAKSRYLLTALAKKGMDDHFPRIYTKSTNLRSEEVNLSQDFLHGFLLAEEGIGFTQRQRKRNLNQDTDEIAKRLDQELDAFYLVNKLQYVCETLNRKNILNTDYQPALLDEINLFLSDPGNFYTKTHPVIAIYYQILLTLQNSDDEGHFHELVSLLKKYGAKIPREQALAMYTFAQNYCIKKINSGNSNYLHQLFALFQDLLEQKVIIEADGHISHWNYKNITTVGLRLKEFDWVETFLEDYKDKLRVHVRENAYTYNFASYYYEQQDYKQAMRLLQQVEFTDVYYHLSAKSILLKIYYEIEDEDTLKYLLIAFKAYLKRNKHISKFHNTTHANLIRFIQKAANLRKRKPFIKEAIFEGRVEDLIKNIAATPEISNANWLKSKVLELRGKKESI